MQFKAALKPIESSLEESSNGSIQEDHECWGESDAISSISLFSFKGFYLKVEFRKV